MRRPAAVLLLACFFFSCAPMIIDDARPPGSLTGRGRQGAPVPLLPGCTEIGRERCSPLCGANQDLVTIQCPNQPSYKRCMINLECSAGSK